MGRLYRLLFLFALWMPHHGWTQTLDCEQTIALATEEFNAGHFYSVPSLLNDCLKSFSREQRLRAYLLLTQTYLLLDDPIGAERSYLEILTANPEFVPDEQLHAIDIVYLSKRFTATPKFAWFVGTGSNVSPVRVIRDLDIMEDADERYTLRAGYHFGVGGEYSYNDNVRIRAEINYLHTTYRSEANKYFNLDVKTFIDRQTWINVPLYLCYADNVGAYRPYGYVGYSIGRLFSDRATIELRRVNAVMAGNDEGRITGNETESFEAASPYFNFLNRRNEFNQSVIFGGGVRYKIGLDFVFAELRYSAGLRNIVNTETRYGDYALDPISGEWITSADPFSQYAHVDDYLRLDNLAITLGFVRPLYKPRELKRARTRGVLRKVKRSK